MNRVAVLTSHLTPGDAVSNDVVGMRLALERQGCEARMFAGSSDFTEPQVYSLSELEPFLESPDDLLIYHYSIGWDPGLEILRAARYRTAIKYHNITPPQFFSGISPWHEEKCLEGRRQLEEIARVDCGIYLADSEYNRQELLQQGVSERKSFVVPPFHHIDRLHAIEPEMKVLDKYRDGMTNILMVGRIAPHKGHPALITAFAAYHHDYNPQSRLFIVGKPEEAFKIYSTQLRELAEFLLTKDAVLFVGEVTESELKAYYLLANAFAMASEHEGFCVPLVESMAMKVPVVAYESSAIPATVGSAGIVLQEREPYLMAEALDRLVRDESLSLDFAQRGWHRYKQAFTNQKIEQRLLEALSNL
jgi:glycosyltransferase involved in cell wall biosynthesis